MNAQRDPIVGTLVAKRAQLGMSQTKLAELMGTTQSHVSNIENGVNGCSAAVLERWASALGYRVALIPEDGGQ